MEAMRQDPRFADTVFKIDEADDHAFKKLKVKHRPELVTLRLEDDVNPNEVTGKYLSQRISSNKSNMKTRFFLMHEMIMNMN